MAKELLITFVYDPRLCQKEEDDPQAAVVYFHPSWITDNQKLTLCGQLVGVTQFMSLNFQKPSIVSFACGKFALRYFNHYILFVGSDRNISDETLESRVETLYQLIRLYHKDICTIDETLNRTHGDNITEKLAHIFQIYLPVLQYSANIFGNIPTFRFPKTASNSFLESMEILKSLQKNNGVVGGMILYQNRVLATQLASNLTKNLVLTDPYRIKLPAENLPVNFNLPVGIQLLIVYVSNAEIKSLQDESEMLQNSIDQLDAKRLEIKAQASSSKTTHCKEMNISIGMKRDASRNFTLQEVDEEEEDGRGESSFKNVKSVLDLVENPKLDTSSNQKIFRAPIIKTVTDFTESKKRSRSLETIPISPSIPVRYYSLGLPKIDDFSSSESKLKNILNNSICDPLCPIFRGNGLPASSFLYDERIVNHYVTLYPKDTEASTEPEKQLTNDETNEKQCVKADENCGDEKSEKDKKLDDKPVEKAQDELKKQEKPKRPMNLNLHSSADKSDVGRGGENQGIPMTPLMAKLTALHAAQNRKTPPTAGTQLNPVPEDDLPSELLNLNVERELFALMNHEKKVEEKIASSTSSKVGDEELKKMILFVYGFQNTTILLILNEDTALDSAQVNLLSDSSKTYLNQLESRLVHSLSNIPESAKVADSYSFLALDPDFGTFYRGGVWVGEPLELVSSLQYNLDQYPELNEIILRCGESVVYGSQCGRTQVFYEQKSESQQPGLPAPSDLMATVSLKAKRRLERDHGLVLF